MPYLFCSNQRLVNTNLSFIYLINRIIEISSGNCSSFFLWSNNAYMRTKYMNKFNWPIIKMKGCFLSFYNWKRGKSHINIRLLDQILGPCCQKTKQIPLKLLSIWFVCYTCIIAVCHYMQFSKGRAELGLL